MRHFFLKERYPASWGQHQIATAASLFGTNALGILDAIATASNATPTCNPAFDMIHPGRPVWNIDVLQKMLTSWKEHIIFLVHALLVVY